MITYKKIISSFFIGLFCLNILIIAIPIQKEGFLDSNEFGAELLRGVGLIGRKQKVYHMVPVLSNPDNYQSVQKAMNRLGPIDRNPSEQTDEILKEDTNFVSGDSIDSVTNLTQHFFQPSFAIGSSSGNEVGVYDSDWDFTDGGSSLSVNLDSSGSNLMALAILSFNNRDPARPQTQTSISSVTFNGDSLTNLGTSEESDDAHTSIWYLKNPDTGSGLSFSLTFNQSVYYQAAAWFAILDGVNLTNTFGPVATYAAGTTNDVQVIVTSTSGDRVFGGVCGETTGHWSVVAPSSELYSYDGASTNTGAAYGNATGSSYTLRWTSPSADHAAAIGVAIHPFIDTISPVINDFGVDDPGTGFPQFWANVTDEHNSVANVTIKLNETSYDMSLNGTGYWVYQPSQVNFSDNYDYQITNASDTLGNYLVAGSSVENVTFDYDEVGPNVLQWDYFPELSTYGTFKANVSDSWGEIDTVIINVTEGTILAGESWAVMTLTASGYMNDTIEMDTGTIKFTITVNDTAGNSFTSSEHQDYVPIVNQAPEASGLTLSRDENTVLQPIFSNCTLYLNYTYSDADGDPEVGTEIRWYKNSVQQSGYDDQKQVPASALIKGDEWNVTVRPKDNEDFGTLQTSETITIQNTAPTLTNVIVTPSNPSTSSDLTVNYDYSDEDSDSEVQGNRLIRWYNNSTPVPAYDDNPTVPASATKRDQQWYYQIRVNDGANNSIWYTSNTETIVNTAPTASDVDITASPKTSDNLVASWTYSDVDGDSENTNWHIWWYKNDAYQSNLDGAKVINSGNTSKGEIWKYVLQVYDGTAYSGNYTLTPTVQIQNTPPTITGDPYIIISNPQTDDVLVGNWTFDDVDNDSESTQWIIRWYKDGTVQSAYNDDKT
ncbi:MAG: hypothetical protein ACXACU_07995, partial [Candidatus Hodarchaeales archaeon]